jgi:very-short-patch-repair endonuclease
MPVGGDREVLRIAMRQQLLATTAQLAAAGLGRHAIAHRVQTGRFTRYHHGVYLVTPVPAPFTPHMAAVLACGDSSVLSHHAAAALWGIREWHGDIDVTVTRGQPRSRRGVRVHRARLDDRERTRHHGIPITTPARTLRDLAPLIPRRDLDRAVEQAIIMRLPGHAELEIEHPPSLTRSEAEARLLELIRAAELPAPLTNVRVHGYEVDLYWPAHRLVLEVDGFAYHSSRAAFERDRLKDARLAAHGVRVSRVTWRQLAGTPEAVLARLAAALAQNSATPSSGVEACA